MLTQELDQTRKVLEDMQLEKVLPAGAVAGVCRAPLADPDASQGRGMTIHYITGLMQHIIVDQLETLQFAVQKCVKRLIVSSQCHPDLHIIVWALYSTGPNV